MARAFAFAASVPKRSYLASIEDPKTAESVSNISEIPSKTRMARALIYNGNWNELAILIRASGVWHSRKHFRFIGRFMGQQHRVRAKRARRRAYLDRKKVAAKAAPREVRVRKQGRPLRRNSRIIRARRSSWRKFNSSRCVRIT